MSLDVLLKDMYDLGFTNPEGNLIERRGDNTVFSEHLLIIKREFVTIQRIYKPGEVFLINNDITRVVEILNWAKTMGLRDYFEIKNISVLLDVFK